MLGQFTWISVKKCLSSYVYSDDMSGYKAWAGVWRDCRSFFPIGWMGHLSTIAPALSGAVANSRLMRKRSR